MDQYTAFSNTATDYYSFSISQQMTVHYCNYRTMAAPTRRLDIRLPQALRYLSQHTVPLKSGMNL